MHWTIFGVEGSTFERKGHENSSIPYTDRHTFGVGVFVVFTAHLKVLDIAQSLQDEDII